MCMFVTPQHWIRPIHSNSFLRQKVMQLYTKKLKLKYL